MVILTEPAKEPGSFSCAYLYERSKRMIYYGTRLSENISRFLLSNDDPEELINFLNTEEEKEIYELKIGENQSTSK